MSVAISDGDAAGVTVCAGGGDASIPPRRRRDVLVDVAQLLADVHPAGNPSISDSLMRAAAPPRLAVVSDFLGQSDRALQQLRVAAAAGSEIFAVHVVAEQELTPPTRTFVAEDPEDPRTQRTMSDEVRDAYVSAFAAWRAQVAGELHAMNSSYVLTSTAEVVRDVVRRVVTGHAAIETRAVGT
jgi:uncharacterized protein (DUF58 family)